MTLPSLRLSTRTLLLAIGVALVPFGLLAFGVLTEIRRSLTEQARLDHQAIVQRMVASLSADFAGLHHAIALLAQDHRVQSMRRDQLHEALHNFLGVHDQFLSIFVYDAGEVVRLIEFRNHFTGADRFIGRTARSLSRSLADKLHHTLETGQPVAHDFLRKESTESQMLLLHAIPSFTGYGRPVGVLSCAIQMYSHQFQDLLEGVQLEGQSYCLVVDRKGRVLARKGTGLPQEVDSVQLDTLGVGSGVKSTWMQVGDRKDLVTAAPLADVATTVIVGRPASEVLALSERIMLHVAIIALVGLIVAVLCALALSRSMVRPILELTDGIRKVGDGATGHRLKVEGDDELAEASTAFNRMAEQLQKGRLMEQIWSREWEDRK